MNNIKTMVQIQNSLLEFFKTNNACDPSNTDHLLEIDVGDVKDASVRKALICAALERMTKHEIVEQVDTEESRMWVLVKPLFAFDRTVTISFDLAIELSRILNYFYSRNPDFAERGVTSDPFGTCEADIRALAYIASESAAVFEGAGVEGEKDNEEK